VVVANVSKVAGEFAASGLSVVDWSVFTGPLQSTDPSDYPQYMIDPARMPSGGPFSSPILADLDRNDTLDVVVTDAKGALHALDIHFGPHLVSDPPASYLSATELPGWPAHVAPPRGALPEVSVGDLEHDGYPEVFYAGAGARVSAIHYNGAMRSGYPLQVADSLAAQDSMGVWPPLIADVERGGFRDVIPVIPDGRRLAFRPGGEPIQAFGQLGSTGTGPPPLLVDLDGDGTAEWIETFEHGSQAQGSQPPVPQTLVTVRSTPVPIAAASVAWPQYRFGPSRDGHVPSGPAGSTGTSGLSEVYGYPNPATGSTTTIHYRLGAAARAVRVRIYDPSGSAVADLPTGPADLAGSAEHNVVWTHDGTRGGHAASGPYLVRVEAVTDGGSEVRFAKVAILR
jgi:hypothetical protein